MLGLFKENAIDSMLPSSRLLKSMEFSAGSQFRKRSSFDVVFYLGGLRVARLCHSSINFTPLD